MKKATQKSACQIKKLKDFVCVCDLKEDNTPETADQIKLPKRKSILIVNGISKINND